MPTINPSKKRTKIRKFLNMFCIYTPEALLAISNNNLNVLLWNRNWGYRNMLFIRDVKPENNYYVNQCSRHA